MDPAADSFKYQVAFGESAPLFLSLHRATSSAVHRSQSPSHPISLPADICELISVTEVMEELQLGPNGALLYAMEFMADNMSWFTDQLETFVEDDYLILDCPGQIELYTHIPVMNRVADALKAYGFNVCAVYCLDALFVTDAAKLIAGNLTALAAMTHLELPHINILTKCDLADKAALEKYLSPSGDTLLRELSASTGPRYRRLNEEMAKLLDDYDMVSFLPLDVTDEESIEVVLMHADHAMQYGEDMEPKEPKDDDYGREDDGGDDDGDCGGGGSDGDDFGEGMGGGAGSNSTGDFLGSYAQYAQLSSHDGEDIT
jgi:hypothetical protein